MQEERIQIIFSEETEYGIFRDALWFTRDQYLNISQDDIDALKKDRVDKWILIMEGPKELPTKDMQIKDIDEEISRLTERLGELQRKKDALRA